MTKKTWVEQLRGATKMAVDATRGVTDIVEAMHVNIGSGPAVIGRPLEGITRLLTAPTYSAVRGVTSLVGSGLDAALARLQPLLAQSGHESSAVLSALNGVLGDYLAETNNPLAIEMTLCRDGVPLELTRESLRSRIPAAGPSLAIFIHGSSMNDEQWLRAGHSHGAALERDTGMTAVYVRYNSGLHISQNGHSLAALIDRLVAAWPVPVKSVALIGHSMGGLVARSALISAEQHSFAWRKLTTKLVTLGTPHHGSALERAGNWADVLLQVSQYSAPLARLGQIRSAGVTDLRFGNVVDADWQGRDRFEPGEDARVPAPLPQGVACYAIAGSASADVAGKPLSDGLVSVESALGIDQNPGRALGFPEANRWVATRSTHLDLLSNPQVYEKLLGFTQS